MSNAPTIWKHAQKFSGSFNNNYYGPIVSGGLVTPKLTSYKSSKKVTFQHSITHYAQKNGVTLMKLV